MELLEAGVDELCSAEGSFSEFCKDSLSRAARGM